jgi:hypothetical protein
MSESSTAGQTGPGTVDAFGRQVRSPAFPKSNPITTPANPGSASPGDSRSNSPAPADPGSRGGGNARPGHRLRPAAKTPTGPAGPR